MRFRIPAVLALMSLSASVMAQKADFKYVQDANPYLTSSNAAGLGRYNEPQVSLVELGFLKDNGGLVGIDGSDDDWKAELGTESYVRISDRIAFWGRLSYSYFKGKNMGGQMLMVPDFNPVNFIESSDTTLGFKSRETYSLAGGLAYSFNDRWSAGVKAEYSAGDMVKTKDPRYRNEMMDMDLSAGVMYSPTDLVSIGLSGIFRNRVEQLMAHIYGVTDKQYYAITDKGGFLGAKPELIEGDYNFVSASSFRPMANTFYGAALQFEIGRDVRLYNEFKYLVRSGYYGKKSSSSPVFFEFGGSVLEYNGDLIFKGSDKLRRIHLDASMQKIDNNENSLRYTTQQGQNTVVEYLGQNKILSRTDLAANLKYDAYLGTSGIRPSFVYGVNASLFSRDQMTTLYPSYRKHSRTRIGAGAYGRKNFPVKSGMISLSAEASYLTGFGVAAEDGSFVPGASAKVVSFDTWMNRQFEYETAGRVGAGLELGYTFFFKKGMAAFVRVSDNFTRLLTEPQYLKSAQRNSLLIAVGLNF
mgnify:CR=1 FL=1